MSSPLISLDEIERNNAEAQALAPLVTQLERVSKRVHDRLFTAQGTSWSTSSTLYSVLRRLSKDDGDLASGLGPIEQFFNSRHPLVVAERAQKRKVAAAAKAQKAADKLAAKAAPSSTAATTSTVPVAQHDGAQPTPGSSPATNGAATNGTTHT